MYLMQGPHTIWAPAADVAAGRAEYAADIGAKIVNFYGDYFGVEYALPKMDMCVQPSFGGAMENWGLGQWEKWSRSPYGYK